MQEDYFESIHPPDLIHFDGRTTPDSACSSLSSPRSSPVPREMQDDVISPITSRTVVLVPMNSTTPLPFDEDVPRKEQEDLKIDVLSQQYEEEEEEPGRIMNCASPRRKDPQLNVANVEIEEKKSETQSPFDEKRRTMDFFTPSYPRDDFEELPLVPTDEKMSVPQKNPRLMDAGLLQLPETEQIGDLNGDTVSSNCNKSGSFDDERFENPSFTPDKQVDYASTSMFQSLANATISAALHIENLIIGPSEQPRTPEQPSWYAENNGARDEIFESMASPADKIKQPSQDGTPNTSRVWVEAESPADVWWSEKDRIDKRNSSVRSPDVSMECTPVISSTVVRRSFGAETLTTAFEEDAPADETGRALSGNFDTPVSLNAPADELRAPLPRRGVDPPPSLVQDAPGDKAEVPPEREIGDIERANIAPNSSNSIVQNSRRSASPHLDTSRKISDPQKVKPHSIQIDDQPLDERRQDKSSPISINGKEETPDDEPAALVPKKVLSPAESALDAIRIDFQKTSSTSEHIIFPGKAHDIGEEHPELKLAVESASPILRASSPLPIAANTKSPQDSDTENGYASDGTDNLLGSLHMLMNDLDNMAQKRGIRTKADQSASFQSCVSTVPEGLLNSSLLSTSGFATPSKAESDVLRDGLPLRINMLNNDLGIAMGDVIISLLHNEDDNKTWVARVNEAVWRCRIVRRNCDTRWLKGKLKKHRDSPSPGRSSVFVDSDDGRVVGKTVQEIQVAAIQHLKYDELSDALELYTEILEKYLSYVPVLQALPDSNYKLGQLGVYIGIAKYDLGIINMLQGEFGIARGLFEEAATMLSVETSIDQWVRLLTFIFNAHYVDETHNNLLHKSFRLFKTKSQHA